MINILYRTGLRLRELQYLEFSDIGQAKNRIKIRQGKGKKDRYALLPKDLLGILEEYYRAFKPKKFISESPLLQGPPVHQRTLQKSVNAAVENACFGGNHYTAHTFMPSFATHLLADGTDYFQVPLKWYTFMRLTCTLSCDYIELLRF